MNKLSWSLISIALIATVTNSTNIAKSQPLAKVEGKLIYPSDYLPSLRVCATTIDSKQRYCVKTKEGQATFSMEIPPNQYMFSAQNDNSSMIAWMTSFNIDCGAACANNPIHVLRVDVESWRTTTEICPCDWYTQKDKLIFPDSQIQ